MMLEKSTVSFLEDLSSKAPVPGGGGASSLVGALAASLGLMVTNLTIGKKKYAEYEEELNSIREKLVTIRDRLIKLVDEDASSFEPLSKAYHLPKDSDNYESIMESALKDASLAPLKIMETILEAMKLLKVLEEKGSKLALSDVGVGILFAEAALEGASLNVYINTKTMKDRKTAESFNQKADDMIKEGKKLKDSIYKKVVKKLR